MPVSTLLPCSTGDVNVASVVWCYGQSYTSYTPTDCKHDTCALAEDEASTTIYTVNCRATCASYIVHATAHDDSYQQNAQSLTLTMLTPKRLQPPVGNTCQQGCGHISSSHLRQIILPSFALTVAFSCPALLLFKLDASVAVADMYFIG